MALLLLPSSSSSSSSYCKVLINGLYSLVIFFNILLQSQQAYSSKLAAGIKINNRHDFSKRKPVLLPNQSSCNLFFGSWVHDDTYPVYQYSSCPVIDPQFNCQMFGRPDSDYLRYRWKPADCDLQRFNGLDFLMKMKGRTVMFVGDSLGRNQWQSLICMISAAVPHTTTQLIRGDPLSVFKFSEFGVDVSFYRTPYLVDIDVVGGKRILRLDKISKNANIWTGADVLMFNSGHWWTHKGELQGWDYMELGGSLYQDMDRLVAFERGMRTWASWADTSIDASRTRVFFQGISPVHYNPSEWNEVPISKNCYGETGPINGSTYNGPYPNQMRVLRSVIGDMRSTTYLLDITGLSQLRKDAHPSIYNGDLTSEQRMNPERSSDCSHWCLPGLPDTWNQLFYTALFF